MFYYSSNSKLLISLLQTVITKKFSTYYCYVLTMLFIMLYSSILSTAVEMLCAVMKLLMSDRQTDWRSTTVRHQSIQCQYNSDNCSGL